MLISREFDYALRILRALEGEGRRTVGEICDIEHVPQAYAYKIIKKLERALILEGYRGKQGGYELAMSLADVSLYDVYLAVEGNLYINECLREGHQCPNNADGHSCVVHRALNTLQGEFVERLGGISIANLLEG